MTVTQECMEGPNAFPGERYEVLTPVLGFAAESFILYWTWKRLAMFVLSLRSGRVPTPGEWQALHREIPSLSPAKKIWLYRQLKSNFSPEAMKYLFEGWKPPSSPVDLDFWL
ncbi:MAG: hypothetical protein LUO93_12340 [Methanomicrobiales archaeon]|nr:hypothetical protein [Methanomicrobiales archaeon]MDD1679958.1 hypothetical protein [Methanomicrobiales archaeon]